MPRERADIGELIARIYDRLDEQFDGKVEIEDALLIVEVSDPNDMLSVEFGHDVPATVVLMESTSDRTTIHAGMMEFARKLLFQPGEEEDDDE